MSWEKILQSAKSISINSKLDIFDFSEQEEKYYAIIGKFLSSVSRLETNIDEFLFDYVAQRPDQWRSFAAVERKAASGERINLKKFPQQFEAKIHFFICSFLYSRDLLQLGDLDGLLDLNSIGYMLEEVFQFRNFLVHGSLAGVSLDGERVRFRYTKHSRAPKAGERSTEGTLFVVETIEFSSGFLRLKLKDIGYLSALAVRARSYVNGVDVVREQREILRGRALMRDLFGKEYPAEAVQIQI